MTSPRRKKENLQSPTAQGECIAQPNPPRTQPRTSQTSPLQLPVAHPVQAGSLTSFPCRHRVRLQRHLKGAPPGATAPRLSECQNLATETQTPQLSDARKGRPDLPKARQHLRPERQRLRRTRRSLAVPERRKNEREGNGRGRPHLPVHEGETKRSGGEIRGRRRTEAAGDEDRDLKALR